jgi:hypothetical protein
MDQVHVVRHKVLVEGGAGARWLARARPHGSRELSRAGVRSVNGRWEIGRKAAMCDGVYQGGPLMNWLLYAFVSAGAAALTAVLAKVGIEGVPSTLATAVRTVVIDYCVRMGDHDRSQGAPRIERRVAAFPAVSSPVRARDWCVMACVLSGLAAGAGVSRGAH